MNNSTTKKHICSNETLPYFGDIPCKEAVGKIQSIKLFQDGTAYDQDDNFLGTWKATATGIVINND